MPWSNQTGGGGGPWGPRGGNGGGPWGQQGGGPGAQPPDLEEMLKRSQDRMKKVMHGGSGVPGPFLLLAFIAALSAIVWYGFFFRVNPDELGVVLRFGKFDRQQGQGLHFRYPYPVEEVLFPKVTRQNITEIGMRSASLQRGFGGTGIQDVEEESLMLTGDENTIDIDFVVYWRIKNAKNYLFNIQNPIRTVKDVAESAMREVVGQSKIQPLLTEGRQKAESSVHDLIQKTLDDYGSGIVVDKVTMQKSDPPAEVIDAFRDVQAARADKERLQNEAYAYANKVVPEARGEAERIIQSAEGYKQQTVEEAKGQAARFLNVYQEYAKAPEVTRKRMFLETMERVLGGTDKIILDDKAGSGVVPYLPLDQIRRTPSTSGAQ